MLHSTILLVTISLSILPCFASPPIVHISKGITESQAKEVHIILGTNTVMKDLIHWTFTFNQEGSRMLPYAVEILKSTGVSDIKNVHIGAIVSISGNGGGIFKLMALLKNDYGCENITIIVIYNIKSNKNQDTRQDYKAFEAIIKEAGFTDEQLFLLEDPSDKKHKYYEFKPLSVEGVIEKLKGEPGVPSVVFDGILGPFLNDTKETMSLVLQSALTILPSICPAEKETEIKLVSNATPSGRSEDGRWVDGAEFVCHSILSVSFPFNAIQVDKPNDANKKVSPPQNILLAENNDTATNTNPATGKKVSFLTALEEETFGMQVDIAKVKAAFGDENIKWVNIVAE